MKFPGKRFVGSLSWPYVVVGSLTLLLVAIFAYHGNRYVTLQALAGKATEAKAHFNGQLPVPARSRSKSLVTIVTGYWNIGEIRETAETNHKHPELYYKWLKFFKNVQNPMVGYFDDQKAAEIFINARNGLPTEIVMTNQSSMWAFGLAKRIKEVIDQPDYPKWIPNTVYPLYACATHAKFESMKHASDRNHFRAEYIAWLDVGLFRDLADSNDKTKFAIGVPQNYDEDMVAFDEVRPMSNKSVERIMKDSPVWVCGCFFLARVQVMAAFAEEYARFTEKYLRVGLANVEQNVIMAMYSPQNTERPKVGIQAYPYDSRYDRWFSLGYLLREQHLAEIGLSSAKRLS